MTPRLSDAQLAAAIAKRLFGQAHTQIEQLRAAARSKERPLVRIEEANRLVQEIDGLLGIVASLATELSAFRRNVQLERDAPPARFQSCLNCRFFDPVVSVEAHIAVERQAIIKDPGVCCYSPPSAGARPLAGGASTTSSFPAVHPERWCGRWEALDSRLAPRK